MSPFFEKGKRAEFFEITDDVIPTFKVTIPDNEYERLIEVSQVKNSWAEIDWENFDWEAFQNGGGDNAGYGNGEGGGFDYGNYGNGEEGGFDYGNYGAGEGGGDGQNLADLMTIEQEDFKTKNATLVVDIDG